MVDSSATIVASKDDGLWEKHGHMIAFIIVFIIILIACVAYTRSSFTPDRVRGWDVEKAASQFMKVQEHMKKKIMDDRVRNLEYY